MSEAPERIWTCSHVGEYGSYFPEAVEAEGEYGGEAVEYVRADRIEELEAKLAKAARDLNAITCQSPIDREILANVLSQIGGDA